jgi:hypothetical protein
MAGIGLAENGLRILGISERDFEISKRPQAI